MAAAVAIVALGMGMGDVAGASAKVAVVKTLKTAAYGVVLTSVKGFVLYTYDKDTKNHSNCTQACPSSWPILSVKARYTPGGIRGLGEITRPNGRHQVTYNGKPLYFFVGDTSRGQITGQGVSGFSVVKINAKSGSGVATTQTRGY
jgi:predicted lipoprotein with Yx(FWY)xxD motif